MQHIEMRVSGMTCGGCVKSVQNALTSREGVVEARADLASGMVTIDFDPSRIQPPELERAITDAGFEIAA